MVGLRVNRCELEGLWSYVGKKQKNVTQRELAVKGDAYTFVAPAPPAISLTAPASATPTIRWSLSRDLRERVIGSPEISADGVHPYKVAITTRSDAALCMHHHQDVQRNPPCGERRGTPRYSPAQVVAVAREIESGVPSHISTS
jgi:hypothetical protein